MYGLIEHQEVFSKAGILSSAFWFAGNASVNHVNTTGKDANVRVYFLAGGQEPASVAQNMYAVRDAMWNVGFSNNETYDLVPTDGQHSEWFWRREFPAAYQWLFAGAVSSTAPIPEIADLKISPNPVRRYFRIQNELEGRLQIIGMDSTLVREMNIAPNERIYISDLPVGMYILRLQTSDKRRHVGKMVKR